MQWQAIVFDLDDTLFPERDYVLSGFRAVANWAEGRLGISAQTGFAELRHLYEAGVRGETFNRWLTAHSAPIVETVPALVRIYREHVPELTPFAEVPKLLDRLRKHYRLGLLSDGYLTVQRAKLAALGLASYFQAVVFSDQWGREHWKPSHRPFRAVAELLGVEPEQAVYVGDNPSKDFLGARQLGFSTVWLRRPDGEYARLEPASELHAPNVTLNSFEELRRHLLPSELFEPLI